jgi:hypothetical protein
MILVSIQQSLLIFSWGTLMPFQKQFATNRSRTGKLIVRKAEEHYSFFPFSIRESGLPLSTAVRLALPSKRRLLIEAAPRLSISEAQPHRNGERQAANLEPGIVTTRFLSS